MCTGGTHVYIVGEEQVYSERVRERERDEVISLVEVALIEVREERKERQRGGDRRVL